MSRDVIKLPKYSIDRGKHETNRKKKGKNVTHVHGFFIARTRFGTKQKVKLISRSAK